jgi:hypothetical protein
MITEFLIFIGLVFSCFIVVSACIMIKNKIARWYNKLKTENTARWSLVIYFDIHDVWLGCYWKTKQENTHKWLIMYFCIVPFLVFRVQREWFEYTKEISSDQLRKIVKDMYDKLTPEQKFTGLVNLETAANYDPICSDCHFRRSYHYPHSVCKGVYPEILKPADMGSYINLKPPVLEPAPPPVIIKTNIDNPLFSKTCLLCKDNEAAHLTGEAEYNGQPCKGIFDRQE